MQMLMLEEVIRLIVSVRYPRERREMERLAPFILSPRLVKACMYFLANLNHHEVVLLRRSCLNED